ncbi:ComEA family DNA-binding protein [Pseudokineococcus sp. 1T1Z-3]|uniref:ComEA family DNA-binding protein n=1 Tax=Pseudokineococcus sp. 1T1Z-3 TaxID=3132745 RepID=UPI0030ABD21C
MPGRKEDVTDAELVRRRLDAVLVGGRAGGRDGGSPEEVEDSDDELDEDVAPGDGRGGHRGRQGAPGRRASGRHVADGDLAEGLGLWPQLVGALADRVPVAVRHGRWGLSGPVVVAVLVVAAVVVLGLAVRSSAGAPGVPVPVRAQTPAAAETTAVPGATPVAPAPSAAAPSAPSPGPAPAPASTASAAGPAEVVVHVVGQVAGPGVVRLPAGSRVGEALEAAGGATPEADLARVNLARVLVDGEQVLVPAPGEEVAPLAAPDLAVATGAAAGGTADGGAGAAPGAGGTGRVSLNTATAADLDALPGIGPVLAQRILDTRAQLGSFTSVEELGEVSGIGEARLADLRDLVVVP